MGRVDVSKSVVPIVDVCKECVVRIKGTKSSVWVMISVVFVVVRTVVILVVWC